MNGTIIGFGVGITFPSQTTNIEYTQDPEPIEEDVWLYADSDEILWKDGVQMVALENNIETDL